MGRLGKTRLLLTQSIAPNVVPPPPVDRIMKGACCAMLAMLGTYVQGHPTVAALPRELVTRQGSARLW